MLHVVCSPLDGAMDCTYVLMLVSDYVCMSGRCSERWRFGAWADGEVAAHVDRVLLVPITHAFQAFTELSLGDSLLRFLLGRTVAGEQSDQLLSSRVVVPEAVTRSYTPVTPSSFVS